VAVRGRRHRLGQHFLVDRGVARSIVGQLAPNPPRVVEIGPGRGALTEPLLERFQRVVAVEVDPELARALQGRLGGAGLELHCDDALRMRFEGLLGSEAPWQLAANLPYSVGTAVVRRLLPMGSLFTRLVVMLQAEVAERMVAVPGERGHGLLALERAAFAQGRLALRVAPKAFRPRPRVDSAVLVLDLKVPSLPADLVARALGLAGRALMKPRKMLRNALPDGIGAVQVEAAGLDPGARPGTVALEGWVRLAGVVRERERDRERDRDEGE